MKLLRRAMNAIFDYTKRIRAFGYNARLFLLSVVLTSLAMGVFHLLFNFYVLSLGYTNELVGQLVTVNYTTVFLAALPMGYLGDLLGRKRSLLAGTTIVSLAVLSMVIFPLLGVLYTMNVLSGIGQSLLTVTMAPFLVENSTEAERVYLFGFGTGLQMLASFAGKWIGGYLPTWLAPWHGASPTSLQAYASALLVVGSLSFLALIPLLLLRGRRGTAKPHERSVFAPIRYAAQHPRLLSKLLLPVIFISLGGGMIMPFMNLFFRQVYHQPDTTIGTLFAWGSLTMALGFMIAPPIADRLGKIPTVVLAQAFSIPFLAILGFAPWFALSAAAYLVRLALMNMGTPVYQNFVMERVEGNARATVASLLSMAWSFGWMLSPSLSGWLQDHYGFGPPFLITMGCYLLAIFFNWLFFWNDPVGRKTRAENPT